MIEMIEGLPEGVIGAKAVGTVEPDDYDTVLIPAIAAATAGDAKARMLFVLGPDFDGYSAGAMLDDARMGFRHWADFERIAVVTDHEPYKAALRAFGFLMPGEVRGFDVDQLDDAKSWLAA